MEAAESKLQVSYRPATDDLPDQSKTFGDLETVELVDWDEIGDVDNGGERVVGTAADGRDIVIFKGNRRVRARAPESNGGYRQFLGYLDDIQEVDG